MTTRISTPFSAQTSAAEVLADVDLTGQRIVVTGGASGIGIETARALAGSGAEVTLAVRNLGAGQQVADEIAEKPPAASKSWSRRLTWPTRPRSARSRPSGTARWTF
ncbi:MAG TPA: SDR family NAD(P)-dependent oxidoreductase [Streptosporangiaceae bacterium]